MSADPIFTVFCDHPDGCDARIEGALHTAGEARALARDVGWKVVPVGRQARALTFCPSHHPAAGEAPDGDE